MTTRRNSIVGALVLCALSFCAFGAASSSAAVLTWHTCTTHQAGGTGPRFSDSHCQTPSASGEFETVEIPTNVLTPVTVTSTAESKSGATIGGIETEIVCTEMMSTAGGVENVNEPMAAKGSGGVFVYSGCTVSKPAGCVVKGGTVTTVSLKSEAFASGAEHKIKFEPEEGTIFTTITLEKCTNEGFNGAKKVTGKVTAVSEGSMQTTSGTAGGELKFGGQTATFSSTSHLVMAGTENTVALETT